MNSVESVIIYVTPAVALIVSWMIRSWLSDVKETLKECHKRLSDLEKSVAFLEGSSGKGEPS